VRERTSLIGREAEMGALRNTLALAARRRRAQFVLLLGDAGVGKSRLAKELASLAVEEHRAQIFGGQCVPYGDANAFGPIGEAFRQSCGLDGVSVSDPAVRARLVERVAQTLELTMDSPETERVVEGLIYMIDGSTRPGVDPSRARDEGLRATLA